VVIIDPIALREGPGIGEVEMVKFLLEDGLLKLSQFTRRRVCTAEMRQLRG